MNCDQQHKHAEPLAQASRLRDLGVYALRLTWQYLHTLFVCVGYNTIMLTLTHEYKLEPTLEQIDGIENTLNVCRVVWNFALSYRKDWCKSRKSLMWTHPRESEKSRGGCFHHSPLVRNRA